MLAEAMGIIQIQFAPWILLPGLFIFLTVMSFNVIGDALRDCLDPRLVSEGRRSGVGGDVYAPGVTEAAGRGNGQESSEVDDGVTD